MRNIASVIKIISLPHGDAPEEVRRGWIGCTMPCEPECGHIPAHVESVLSTKPKKPLRAIDVLNGGMPPSQEVAGYSVDTKIALKVLVKKSPEAARWFRRQGYPKKGITFRFSASEVKVVSTVPENKGGKLVVYDDMETGRFRPMN